MLSVSMDMAADAPKGLSMVSVNSNWADMAASSIVPSEQMFAWEESSRMSGFGRGREADAGPRADSAELDHLALAIAAEDNVHGGGSGSLAITIATSARAARAAIAAAVAAAAGVAVAALGARGIASDSARASGGGHGGG